MGPYYELAKVLGVEVQLRALGLNWVTIRITTIITIITITIITIITVTIVGL